MPATYNEAADIVNILSRYLPMDKALALANDLHNEVAQRTTNESLRVTLIMLRNEITDRLENKPVNARSNTHFIVSEKSLVNYSDK